MKFENDDTIERVNCICHLLNNVVCYMCAVEPVKNIIEQASALVSFIRNSGLGEKCNPKLQKYIDSRWNTVFYTLNSIMLNYSQIAQILLEKEQADKNSDVMHKLTVIWRNDLEIISQFLKKFKVWTNQLEADKHPTLWMFWPTFVFLNSYLADNCEDSDIIRQMKQTGRRYIEANANDLSPKMVHKVSTVLHPILKNIALASDEERTQVYGMIDDFIWKAEPFHETASDKTNAERQDSENQEILDAFMGASKSNIDSPQQQYTEEFQTYLLVRLPSSNPYDFDLCAWWHKNRYTFPNLYRLFLSKAGIAASSTSSERKFSETGIIISARRANLLPETVSNLVLARNNLMNFL